MAYWNSADKSAAITLSLSDALATTTSYVWHAVRSVDSHSAGKYYAEFVNTVEQFGSGNWFGFADSSHTITGSSFGGSDAGGIAYASDGTIYHNGALVVSTFLTAAVGDTIMAAVDLTNDKYWWGVNGVWASGGDPAAGTGEQASAIGLGTVFLCGTTGYFTGPSTGDAILVRTALADFAYSPPSGFAAWDGAAAPTAPAGMFDPSLTIKGWF